ncbi:Uma2 family endonuclease [Azospirillum sp. sgz301742]
MQTALRKPWISPEDYLTYERTADVRHEYVDGEVYAMVGATRRHSTITLNLARNLQPSARRRGCEVYATDVKVRVEAANAFYYPDLVATCDARDDDPYIVQSPSLIVEVLSASTEAIDRREKRMHYQTIPSLREFLLVAQDEQLIEVYRRTASGWICEIVREGELVLESVGVAVALDDIYT